MDVRTAVKERRSIRKYKPDEVTQNIVREILEDARWSPSWANTQGWGFYVVTGDTLEKLKKTNREKILAGETSTPEIPMPEEWPEKHNQRYGEIVKRLLDSLTIAREDTESRNELYGKMFSLFDAPCLLVVCLDKGLSIEYAMLDMGLVIQTICLLAHERGLGTCILTASVTYPELLRELVKIPDDKSIVMGIALGYPDWDSPANKFERVRANLDELVNWVG